VAGLHPQDVLRDTGLGGNGEAAADADAQQTPEKEVVSTPII
jgi:hypothetical protein